MRPRSRRLPPSPEAFAVNAFASGRRGVIFLLENGVRFLRPTTLTEHSHGSSSMAYKDLHVYPKEPLPKLADFRKAALKLQNDSLRLLLTESCPQETTRNEERKSEVHPAYRIS